VEYADWHLVGKKNSFASVCYAIVWRWRLRKDMYPIVDVNPERKIAHRRVRMEGWRQWWRLGERNNFSKETTKNRVTPTGLRAQSAGRTGSAVRLSPPTGSMTEMRC
jgi:hypothetical protein